MQYFKGFVLKMLFVQAVGIGGLLLSGLILTIIQDGYYDHDLNFFNYRMETLDQIPAWFFFVMLQLGINGFWLFKLSVLEGVVATPMSGPYGNWAVQVPINYLRVFAVNLVLIPAAIFGFMIIRQFGI